MTSAEPAREGKPACKACPWREDSGVAYDEDGLAAYLAGYDASCHSIVGLQAVFHNQPAKPGQECRGPDNFHAGVPGYRDATEIQP